MKNYEKTAAQKIIEKMNQERNKKTTRDGIAVVDPIPVRGRLHSYAIVEAPFGSSIVIPEWLKTWRFENEYHAGLVQLLYANHAACKKLDEVLSPADFQNTVVRGTFRLLQLDSIWT